MHSDSGKHTLAHIHNQSFIIRCNSERFSYRPITVNGALKLQRKKNEKTKLNCSWKLPYFCDYWASGTHNHWSTESTVRSIKSWPMSILKRQTSLPVFSCCTPIQNSLTKLHSFLSCSSFLKLPIAEMWTFQYLAQNFVAAASSFETPLFSHFPL